MNTIFKALKIFLLLVMVACSGGYSFTGIDSGDAQTYSVKMFPNYAALVNVNLSLAFTENLKQTILQQTPLQLITKGGDLQFEGSIVTYTVNPISAKQETASQNRLTITVKTKFINNLDNDKNYEQNFTRYRDYDASQSFSSVEAQLVDEIIDELAEDIINKAIGGW